MPEKFAMLYQPPTKSGLGAFLQARRRLAAAGVLSVAGVIGMHVLYSPPNSAASNTVDRPNQISDTPEEVLREAPTPVALSNNSSPTPPIESGLVTESPTSPRNDTEKSGQSSPEQRTGKSAAPKQKVVRRQRAETRAYPQYGSQYSFSG